MTREQARLVQAIRDLTSPDGVSPTVKELATHLQARSVGHLHDQLVSLRAHVSRARRWWPRLVMSTARKEP